MFVMCVFYKATKESSEKIMRSMRVTERQCIVGANEVSDSHQFDTSSMSYKNGREGEMSNSHFTVVRKKRYFRRLARARADPRTLPTRQFAARHRSCARTAFGAIAIGRRVVRVRARAGAGGCLARAD